MRENYLSLLLMLGQLMCCICKTPRIISHLTCYLSSKDLISIVNALLSPNSIIDDVGIVRIRARWLWLITLISDHRSWSFCSCIDLSFLRDLTPTLASMVDMFVCMLSFPFIIPCHSGVYLFWFHLQCTKGRVFAQQNFNSSLSIFILFI